MQDGTQTPFQPWTPYIDRAALYFQYPGSPERQGKIAGARPNHIQS